jgi:hypothetical protein
MDADRFDALSRSLGSGFLRGPRRTLLAALASGFLTALVLPDDHAAAKKKRKKKKKKKTCRTLRCPECAPCDQGTCQPQPEGTPCSLPGGGGQCLQGQCLRVIPCNPATTPSTCPPGQGLDQFTCECVALA